MEQIKLDTSKAYKLTKILDTGDDEVKIEYGSLMNEDGIIKIDHTVMVGSFSYWWRTSIVTGIEKTGRGVLFETWNSTYLLEEVKNERRAKRDP